MHHDTPLITTIVAGLVLAFIFGAIANRFRMPPLVGYLFAGILVGPYTPGFVADGDLATELAEIGVVLLMFGVGLHFSLRDLMSVRALAIPGAIVQMSVATLLGLGLALLLGWSIFAGIVFGLSLSVASTVVLLKAMQDRRLIETERGRIAVGWLIVEDLAMVLALVLVPAIATLMGNGAGVHDPFVSFVERVFRTEVGIWGVLGLTLLKVAAFVGFMLIVGRRVIPWALHATAHTGSRELFRLAVLAIALGVALGSSVLFGVSLALGAFFAGMILSESELSHRAAQETLPLRDAFAVLFFVSVGMLFDPSIVITSPLPLLATVLIIVVGKSIAAFGIVVLFKRPVSTALTISASLAQIGEFSFILASMGVALAILPPEGQSLILAGALISIVLNPVVFWVLDLVKPRLEAKAARRKGVIHDEHRFEGPLTEPGDDIPDQVAEIAPEIEVGEPTEAAPMIDDDDDVHPTKLSDHTILVGFGRVGSVVGEGLHAAHAPLVVIEDSDTSIKAARDMGIEVVVGNASSTEILKLANLQGARTLLIAIPNSFEAGQVTEQSRRMNARLTIIARAHSDEEESYLANLGADTVIMGEREIGLGMLAWVRGERAEMAAAAAQAIRMVPGAGIPEATEAAAAATVLEAGPEPRVDVPEAVDPATLDDIPTDTDARAYVEAATPLHRDEEAVVPVALPDEPVAAPAPTLEADASDTETSDTDASETETTDTQISEPDAVIPVVPETIVPATTDEPTEAVLPAAEDVPVEPLASVDAETVPLEPAPAPTAAEAVPQEPAPVEGDVDSTAPEEDKPKPDAATDTEEPAEDKDKVPPVTPEPKP
jgi:CPA2 family monovalent cation:H+ antiporter-2